MLKLEELQVGMSIWDYAERYHVEAVGYGWAVLRSTYDDEVRLLEKHEVHEYQTEDPNKED